MVVNFIGKTEKTEKGTVETKGRNRLICDENSVRVFVSCSYKLYVGVVCNWCQLGMASQRIRSAFMLTTIAFISASNTIYDSVVAGAIVSGDLASSSSGFSENIAPKFGDRISPRNRPFLDVDKVSSNVLRTALNSGAAASAAASDLIDSGNNFYHYPNHNNQLRTSSGTGSSSSISSSNLSNGAIKMKKQQQQTLSAANSYAGSIDYNDDIVVVDGDGDGDGGIHNDGVIDDSVDGNDETDAYSRHSSSSSSSSSSVASNNLNNKLRKKSNRGLYARGRSISDDDDVVDQTAADADTGDDRSTAITNIELPALGKDFDIRDGNASSAQAHRLEMSTEFFVVPSTMPSLTAKSGTAYQQHQQHQSASSQHRPGGIILPNKNKNAASIVPPPSLPFGNSRGMLGAGNATQPTIISTHSHNTLGLRKEPWVVPVLVLTSLAMLMMAAFEIFVLCKAWQTSPSRRHLFLGQMLLLGLFMCAGLAAILTTTPTVLSCGIVRFGAGVSFALVFASLLVKCVFLISLNSGVYLPAPYQGLLLLFAVLIQVAVGGQWLLTTPAAVEDIAVPIRTGPLSLTRYSLLLTAQDITMTIPLCKTQFPDLLYSLVYVVFLILFVAVLAIKSRRIRENYREATYIGLAIGGSIPIWLGWTLCGLAVAERHKDACLAFGLVATSATVFLVMFMPKGRQLAAMGKEGLYIEDRDEQFSSLSRAGSGYSPSFFHFKPIKYGVMGNTLASTTNTTNNTAVKHQAVASLGNGKLTFECHFKSIIIIHHHHSHPLLLLNVIYKLYCSCVVC